MTLTRQHSPEIILIALALLLRLAFALLPQPMHLMLLEDDAWMVTNIARHWARGHGITADGVHPTNGFHPLYPLTLGALPYLLRPEALDWGFQANVVICALLNTLALLPLLGLLQLVARRAVALAGLAIIALNPFFIRVSVNGMETSLALLLLLLLWWVALARPPTTMRGGLLLGGLAGLASLARLDSLLAAGLVGIFLLWREGRAWRLPRVSLSYGLATGLILLPYFARNLLVFGHLTPSSGRALAYMHSYAESFAFTSGLQLIAYQPAIDLTWAPAWLLFAGGIVLVGMVWSLASAQRALLAPLLLYAVVLTFYYAYLQQQGRPRYYVAVGVVVVLVLCAWLSDWWRKQENKPASPLAAARINLFGKSGQEPQILRITRRDAVVETLHATSLPLKPPLPTTESRIARGATLLVAVFAISLNTVLFVRHIRELQQAPYLAQPAMYQAARWIAHNLPPDARLAAQNSGVFQYYSERVVINIDGKLNHEIIPVLEQRAILDYLHAKGVRYIVDLEGVADYITFYSSRLSDAPAHQELSSLDKMVIYARLIAAKVGMAPPVELDERRPTRIIHPFDEIVQVVKTFPLPNNPDEAVMIYHLEDVESGERKAESGERIADTHHSSLITRHWYDG